MSVDIIQMYISTATETHPSPPPSADLASVLASVLTGYNTIHLVSWSLGLVICIMGVIIAIFQDCGKDGNNGN